MQIVCKAAVALAVALSLSACGSMRTVGNNEMHYLSPAKCSEPGTIKRDDKCYSRIIVSAKDDAKVVITHPDGLKIEVDNSGQPSFAHDLATTVQAVALQKAMDND